MSLESMYSNIQSGCWMDPDPKECGCRGRGWYVSDLDTAHICQYHWQGQHHPDCEGEDCWCDERPEVVRLRAAGCRATDPNCTCF